MSILKVGRACCDDGLRLRAFHFEQAGKDSRHLQDMGLNAEQIGPYCWKNDTCPGCGTKVKVPYVRKEAYDRLGRQLRGPKRTRRLKSFVEEDAR